MPKVGTRPCYSRFVGFLYVSSFLLDPKNKAEGWNSHYLHVK